MIGSQGGSPELAGPDAPGSPGMVTVSVAQLSVEQGESAEDGPSAAWSPTPAMTAARTTAASRDRGRFGTLTHATTPSPAGLSRP
jgi:hypothetical protein